MINRRSLAKKIIEDGEIVYYHSWDSGGLGSGRGTETVYRLDGKYAVSPSDGPCRGPYASLETALTKNGLLMVNEATACVSCTCLSSEELAGMLFCDEDGKVVGINGENWTFVKGAGFQREEEP